MDTTIPHSLNRWFSAETLRDWWRWQRQHPVIDVPAVWLHHQNNVDLWLHLFNVAREGNSNYLSCLVQACARHQHWSMEQWCTGLMYWDQHSNLLADTELMERLLPLFAQHQPSFCRAAVLAHLMQDQRSSLHLRVLSGALKKWDEHAHVSSDSVVWGAFWDCFTHRTPSSELVGEAAEYFSLRDFLSFGLPVGAGRMNERDFQCFKAQQGLVTLRDLINGVDGPFLRGLRAARLWPAHKITAGDLVVLDEVYHHAQTHKQWVAEGADDWAFRDWLTQLRLECELDEAREEGDNKGRRRM